MIPVLRTEKLCKSFSNGGTQQHVIKNLDLTIMEGDFTVIMGASGSGKSTLLYALSGMDKPSLGKIYFGDTEIQNYSNDQLAVFRRGNCGFVFQNIYLLENQNVLDNVLTGAFAVQKYSPKLIERVKETLTRLGLGEEMQRKYPNQLSGGEAQRVGIVRAINDGYEAGDNFTVTSGGRKYPFTVAGIYKCGLLADTGSGRKLVISDYDYMLLSAVYPEKELLIFDKNGSFDFGEYSEKCSERTSENFSKACSERTVEDEKYNETTFLLILLYICAFISGVTIAAVIFLIRHKITKDIEDQMKQIGVLEALGYRSREISLSYVCEYILSGGTGALLGGIGALCFVPVMNGLCTSIVYRSFEGFPSLMRIIAAVLLVAFLAVGFAVVKAGAIKRIPPVTAFRKGIKSHHFGKNVFPLERLKNA